MKLTKEKTLRQVLGIFASQVFPKQILKRKLIVVSNSVSASDNLRIHLSVMAARETNSTLKIIAGRIWHTTPKKL